MKCKVSLLVITSLILTSVVSAAGSESGSNLKIEEKTDLKTVIECKQIDLKKVPIEIDNLVLVPAVELFESFGIKNEKPYINLDMHAKSLTINYNSQIVVFRIGSSKVNVNNTVRMTDVPSVEYKNTVYVPLDFTASLFDKTITTDNVSHTLFVRSTSEFRKTKLLLQKIKLAQGAYRKARFEVRNGPFLTHGEVDREKGLMHFFSPFYGTNDTLEMYIIANSVFFRSGTEGRAVFGNDNSWGYFKIMKPKLQNSFNIPLSFSDTECAGLSPEEDKKNNRIILEGDIYIDDFYKRPTIYYEMTKYNEVRKAHTRLEFNNKTLLLNYGRMDIEYLYLFTNKIENDIIQYKYEDYNTNKINVQLDDKSIKNANNLGNTLNGSGFEMFENYVEQ